jgi:hypothetical protein
MSAEQGALLRAYNHCEYTCSNFDTQELHSTVFCAFCCYACGHTCVSLELWSCVHCEHAWCGHGASYPKGPLLRRNQGTERGLMFVLSDRSSSLPALRVCKNVAQLGLALSFGAPFAD